MTKKELQSQEKIRSLGEKKKKKIPGNMGSGRHQQSGDERKIRKEYLRWTPGNEALQQKSHQSDKHLVSTPYWIIETNIKMDNGRTLRNRPEDKKVDNDTQGLIPERWHNRLHVSKKEWGRGFASIGWNNPILIVVNVLGKVGLVSLLNGISVFVGYLVPKLFS